MTAFDHALGIPDDVSGTGGTAPASSFACLNNARFGFVANSKTSDGNTVDGAVAPNGAATLPATIAALNRLAAARRD